jgi:phosphoglycerate dehydrogenase-like enzyme
MKVLIGWNPMGLEKAIPGLQERFPELEFVQVEKREDTLALIADADVYVGWMNRDVFLAAKKLKWVQSPSSGIDYYLAIPEFKEGDALLTSASGTHAACLAESVLGMILAFTRGIRDSILVQSTHEWALRQIRPKLVELTGSTLGIIGLGRVGRALAKRAAAFDMRIVAVDAYPGAKSESVEELWGLEGLEELLKQSDYVVVTVPRTSETIDMIGAEQLATMKSTAILVGISRGGIINQEALADALREGQIAAAATDVAKPEPLPPESELWDLENMLITPHIAGGTQLESQHVIDILTENLAKFLKGDLPLRNQVDKEKGF